MVFLLRTVEKLKMMERSIFVTLSIIFISQMDAVQRQVCTVLSHRFVSELGKR